MPEFHASAEDIHLDDGHILKARLINSDGEHVDAEVDLNDFIGNVDGAFEWGGNGFSHSAESIHFELEGSDAPILRARLFNAEGEAIDRDINLSERIGNNNGQFEFE